jgi:hypothetical protein
VLVHDRTTGTLVNQHKTALLEEITKQLLMGTESLMEDDKFLLECNLSDIVTTSGKQQEYWLLAIQAAQKAGQLQAQQGNSNAPGYHREQACLYFDCDVSSFRRSDHVSSEFPRHIKTWKES